jgi:4-amino-4-deoxy-L-arabinose transferase-like glycosyltransferase
MTRRHYIWLLAILSVALILRVIQVGERDIWYDEAFTILFTQAGIQSMLTATLTPTAFGAAEIHPLLYYTLLSGWIDIFGAGVVAVRAFSVLLGVLTVLVVFALASDLFGIDTGLAAAAITALAPFHVQYSQEARMYSLLALLLMLATWAFWRAWRSARRISLWWLVFGVCAAASVYTQQLGAFYLAAFPAFALSRRRSDKLPGFIVGVSAALLLYAPWLIVALPAQLERATSTYWVTTPTAITILITLRSFLTVNLAYPAPSSMLGLGVALVLMLFLLVQLVIRRRRTPVEHGDALSYSLYLFVLPIAGLFVFSQWRALYIDRALIGCAIMLYIALAWMFIQGGLPGVMRVALAFIGLVGVGIGLYYGYTWSSFPNSPFRAMTDQIAQAWQAGDIIIHQDKLSALPARVYAPALSHRFLRDEPGSADDTFALSSQQSMQFFADHCVQSAARGARRVWWVVLSPTPEQYALIQQLFADQIAWLDASFATRELYQLNDLIFTLYTERLVPLDQGMCDP